MQRIISDSKTGRVRVDWLDEVSPDTRLKLGGRVFAKFPYPEESIKDYHFAVIYEDQDFVAIDKPAGVLVHPTARVRENCVVIALRRQMHLPELRLAHRLDRDTSGVLLLAKHAEAAGAAGIVLQKRGMQKTYVARVEGGPSGNHGEINLPIGDDRQSEVRVRQGVITDGYPSLTKYRVLKREETTTVLELQPVSGRSRPVACALRGHGLSDCW